MPFDPQEQRRIMGKFATGVTVASTRTGDDTWGMTANAVTSLSLDPPLVLLCVAREAQSHAKFTEAGFFALNILSADQQTISDRFAFKGPKDFSDLETTVAETGAPVLTDALGWVDCRIVDTVTAGDHDMFIGEIVAGAAKDGQPLLYFAGGYSHLAAD
ncbi:MAG: hypothetical protein CMJ59_01530 [Planctomycetaceae bacterium]|nr:hypothetical protein [Planctomycetaceae bacterium]